MSLQNKMLAGATLMAMLSLGLVQSADAIPFPEQTDGQLMSQAVPYDYDTTTRVAAEVISVFGDDYVKMELPDGETRLVAIPDDAFDTRRIIPGSDVILTMQGDRIIDIAVADDDDLIALEEEQRARETAMQEEVQVSPSETIVQTERVEQEQVVQQRQEVRQQQTQVTPPSPRPVRAMW